MSYLSDRRDFLKSLLVGSAGALAVSRLAPARSLETWCLDSLADDPWARVPQILARLKAPVFPQRDFEVTKFGAKGDGKLDCTGAFHKAIDACTRAGGGRVVVPEGEFATGAIHLQSNVNLHLTRDATIKFDRDPKKYLPLVFTRWEGMELM